MQETLLLLLIFITIAAPLMHIYGLNKTMVWDFPAEFKAEAVNDAGGGGSSTAQLVHTDSSVILQYSLQAGSPFPLAGAKFFVGQNSQHGVDFSSFDSVKVWLTSTDTLNTVKIILKNFNAAYSHPDDPVSLKYNEIEYKPRDQEQPFSFAIRDLSVPSWWVGQRHIPVEHIRSDVSNVVEIEIPTGSTHKLNTAQMEIKSIQFTGKSISADLLYLSVLLLWLLSAAIYLALRFFQQIRENRELKIHSANLKTAAEQDSLTLALNRNGMYNKLEELKKLPPEHSFPICIIMMDIDHFKQINDTHGHATGDEVLTSFTKRIQSIIRSRDLLVRWGGEEFIVISLNTQLSQGVILAEKLRQSLIDFSIHPSTDVRISCGVAVTNNWDITQAIETADVALYRAKTQGRNQVCHTCI